MNQDPQITTNLRNYQLLFHTTWGLFSPEKIDEGTNLLLEEIPIKPNDKILDLGCGYGVIGICLAKEVTQGTVQLVDKDFVAIEYTKKNIKENKLTNATAYLSNGLQHVPDLDFTIIASNIPAKVGNELLTTFLLDAMSHLAPGGTFYFVTVNGLREYMKRKCNEVFGNYQKIRQAKSYCVGATTKT